MLPSVHQHPLLLFLVLSSSSSSSPLLQLVGILLAQILINQIRDQIKLQLYNQQHRADPWY